MRHIWSMLLVTALLVGCGGVPLGDLASMAGVGGSAGNGPDGPVSPPALSGSPSACYEGTWALLPETAWSAENLQRMGLGSDDYRYVGSQGDAWLTLQPNGTYQWSLNRFAVTLRGDASGSSPTDVTVHMHGTIPGTARPGASQNELDMAVQGASARLTSFAEVSSGGMGGLGRINLDVGRILAANAWTADYQCGAGTLRITGQDDAGGPLQNARYTAVR